MHGLHGSASFKDARAFVRGLGLKSGEEWREFCRGPEQAVFAVCCEFQHNDSVTVSYHKTTRNKAKEATFEQYSSPPINATN